MAYLHDKDIVHADLTATSVLILPTPVEPEPRGSVLTCLDHPRSGGTMSVA